MLGTKHNLDFYKNYYCPSCKYTFQLKNPKPTEVPLHKCLALNNLQVPWVLEGINATHKVELREDYLGNDIASARDSSNNVVKSVSTEFDDGSNGGTIYLPCARFSLEKE